MEEIHRQTASIERAGKHYTHYITQIVKLRLRYCDLTIYNEGITQDERIELATISEMIKPYLIMLYFSMKEDYFQTEHPLDKETIYHFTKNSSYTYDMRISRKQPKTKNKEQ